MKPLTLIQRAEAYNAEYSHLPTQRLFIPHDEKGKPFLVGYWFISGGNVSNFWGSYQIEYLKRIAVLFPDCRGKEETVHLFSGSLPPSADYTRVGKDGTGQYKSDLEVDAHELSSWLKFRPSLILADPPYNEIEEAGEQYGSTEINSANAGKVNRPRVLSECARILRPGGFIVWMDTALPVFSNSELRLCGCISYIRSTGNHFRCVSLFQRPIK